MASWFSRGKTGRQLFFTVFFDDAEHRFGIRSFLKGLTKFFFVKQLGDVGQRVKMFLKLALGHEKKHDEA